MESNAFWYAFATGDTQEVQVSVRWLVGHTPTVTPDMVFVVDKEEEEPGVETKGGAAALETYCATVAAWNARVTGGGATF